MEKIDIDFDVHKEIEKRRNSFNDSPNNVLRRVLGLPDTSKEKENGGGVNGNSTFLRTGVKPGLDTKGVLLPNGMKLRNESRGKIFEAEITNGMLVFNGAAYKSLSKAACVATGVSTNGWTFWHYRDDETGRWILTRSLR